jgi:hypothetical protein
METSLVWQGVSDGGNLANSEISIGNLSNSEWKLKQAYVKALEIITGETGSDMVITALRSGLNEYSEDLFQETVLKRFMSLPGTSHVVHVNVLNLGRDHSNRHYQLQIFLRLWYYASPRKSRVLVRDPIPGKRLKEVKSYLTSFTMSSSRNEFREFVESELFDGFKESLCKTVRKLGHPFFEEDADEMQLRKTHKTVTKITKTKQKYADDDLMISRKVSKGNSRKPISDKNLEVAMFVQPSLKKSKIGPKPSDVVKGDKNAGGCDPLLVRNKRYSLNHFTAVIGANMMSKTLLRRRKVPPYIPLPRALANPADLNFKATSTSLCVSGRSRNSLRANTSKNDFHSTKELGSRNCSKVMETPVRPNTIAETPSYRSTFPSPPKGFSKKLFLSPQHSQNLSFLQSVVYQTPTRIEQNR